MSAVSSPSAVPALTPGALAGIVRRFAEQPGLWRPQVRFESPERYYVRLGRATGHEVWLLTWLPGQGTDLHDHGGSAGAFHVFSGTLTEDTVATIAGTRPRVTSRELSAGAGRRFGTRHIHRIINRSTRPAISIHVYGPALTTMTRYRIGAESLNVIAIEQAGVQW